MPAKKIIVKLQNEENEEYNINSSWTVEKAENKIKSHFDLKGGSLYNDELPIEYDMVLSNLRGDIFFKGGKANPSAKDLEGFILIYIIFNEVIVLVVIFLITTLYLHLTK